MVTSSLPTSVSCDIEQETSISLSLFFGGVVCACVFKMGQVIVLYPYAQHGIGGVKMALVLIKVISAFPDSSAGKESVCNAGDPSSIPRSESNPWRRDRLPTPVFMGFTGGSDGKESACNAGDLGSIPGLRKSPGGGHGNPLQHSGESP